MQFISCLFLSTPAYYEALLVTTQSMGTFHCVSASFEMANLSTIVWYHGLTLRPPSLEANWKLELKQKLKHAGHSMTTLLAGESSHPTTKYGLELATQLSSQ